MFRKSTTYRIPIAICLTMVSFFAFSQNNFNCEKAEHFVPDLEKRIAKISIDNPEVVSLHYLFVKDMLEQMSDFRKNSIPNLHFCDQIDYYPTIHRCDTLEQQLLWLKDTLEIQRHRVDTMFYQMAVEEIELFDTILAEYYLDRSLQFNPLNTDALILKTKILFDLGKYDECIEDIHIIYNEAPLLRRHENEMSDFTALFYDHLFTMGDSLVKLGHASDALPIFQTLENFCHNMPTSYCNDDYYHGIIRSKSGIYESYLTIAQVAWKRKNYDLAYKFLDYAYDYRSANIDEIETSSKFTSFINELESRRNEFNIDDESTQNVLVNEPVIQETVVAEEVSTDTTVSSPIDITPKPFVMDTTQQLIYDNLIIDALYNLLNGQTERAKQHLISAKEMEECNCVKKDPRVQLLYEEFYNKSKKRKK